MKAPLPMPRIEPNPETGDVDITFEVMADNIGVPRAVPRSVPAAWAHAGQAPDGDAGK